MGASIYFTKEQQHQITESIRQAELDTSGEIRVRIERFCREDVLDHAAWLFYQLEMEKTAQRNGVLIYVAVESRKFAVIGDKGINSIVPPDFWDSVKEIMRTQFAQGNLTDGISLAVLEAGKLLKQHFQYRKDDTNELPDDISFGI